MTDSILVLDASVAVSALFPNPMQECCRELIRTFGDMQPIVPTLWAYETLSAITKAVHFNLVSTEEGRQYLDDLRLLPIQMISPDPDLIQSAYNWTLKLNRAAAYDSIYIALAETLACPFWTADKRLIHSLGDALPNSIHWIGELKRDQ
jgi:predicted nucleic acid-binding protein